MSDHPLVVQYKGTVEAEITSNKVWELAGTVLGYSASGSRQALSDEDQKAASTAYRLGQYDVALDRFAHSLALYETDPKATIISDIRATQTSNIATCLHFLGQTELALEYYQRAMDEFSKIPGPYKISPYWLLYGDLNAKRIEYLKARVVTLEKGEAPDNSVYQDGHGKERKWSKEEMEGRVATWSYFNPMTWFGRGYAELGSATSAPPAAPATSSSTSFA